MFCRTDNKIRRTEGKVGPAPTYPLRPRGGTNEQSFVIIDHHIFIKPAPRKRVPIGYDAVAENRFELP